MELAAPRIPPPQLHILGGGLVGRGVRITGGSERGSSGSRAAGVGFRVVVIVVQVLPLALVV